jgi:hypothetical protein
MALVCWKCGASLEEMSLPLLRLDECPQCHAELHVCKMCEWYSVAVAKHCRETIAEEVKDKERANFCDYFKPKQDAHSPVSADAAKAKTDLEALFGGGSKSGEAAEPSAADKARAELEALFGKKPD